MDPTELAFAGIARQAELIRSGEISSAELTDLYLDRIERIDPQLNCFSKVHAERARAAAKAADERVAAGESGPLLGVPVALKDELDEAGEVSANGSRAFTTPAREDCFVVERLKQAGAHAIGRTTLPELAICGFTETAAFGITRNPWDTDRTPGGSSGGSAAAVAAGMVGAASASDGAGSIRIPAANNGLFGLKPQRDRISLAPHREHWHGMSVTGCEARRVVDSALWLDVCAGNAPTDPTRPDPPARSYVEAAGTLPGRLRIGWTGKPLVPARLHSEMRGALAGMVEVLDSLGHSTHERDPDWGYTLGNDMTALYLNGIAVSAATADDPRLFEPRTKGFVRIGNLFPGWVVEAAKRRRAKHAARINEVFEHCDVLITPTTARPAVKVGRWEGRGAIRTMLGMSQVYPYCVAWNYLGQPAAAVPAGTSADGLPLSVQLLAPPGREDLLLSLAAQIEAEINWPDHRPPIG